MAAVERGEKNITIQMLVRITKVLNISLVELFKRV
jgi:transcriptional regulator with XRE-family HTH domain